MPILSCSAPDCEAPVFIKKLQLCQPHYNRFMSHGDLNAAVHYGHCSHCGAETIKGATGPLPRYCSKTCRERASYDRRKEAVNSRRRAETAAKPKPVATCERCGESRVVLKAGVRFCSSKCATQFRRENPDGSCSVLDCGGTAEARGLCIVCWKRDRRSRGLIQNEPWNERRKAGHHKRRALKLNLPADNIRPADVYERDGWVCGLCAEPVDRNSAWPDPMSPSLDHVLPLSKGGHHVLENVQLAHLSCNVRKGARIQEPVSA